MLVNAALDVAAQDPGLQKNVAGALAGMESFFLDCTAAGQANGTITRALPAKDLAGHLLGVLMGVRVLARAWLERALLEGVVRTALVQLSP